jgi:hypothetical protein
MKTKLKKSRETESKPARKVTVARFRLSCIKIVELWGMSYKGCE